MKLIFNIIVIAVSLYLSGCEEVENIDIPKQLTGCWSETDESESNIYYQIRELRFDADGYFSVTWSPFEVYKDYWGSYEFDNNTGSVSITVTGGNYVPETLDLSGNIQINLNNELILLNMYLGAPPSSTNIDQVNRKYIFTKFSDSCSGAVPQ